MRNIQIPISNNAGYQNLSIEKNIIIVGANGAGKTRMGSIIEQQNSPTKRISAQRMLQITDRIPKLDFEEALQSFLQLYKNQSPVTPQNDYQQLLSSIFSEETRRDSNYVKKARESSDKPLIPDSVIDKIIRVWNDVFPHRKIVLEKYRVMVQDLSEGSSQYSGVEMSDGEKVGLYLISQVFLADRNCIIIIDEPELHLHKSLMVRLWNKLEECRSDCAFVYITHDLAFAASKPSCKIIWVRSFKNSRWEWNEVDPNGVIPEDLYLEMLGSRKPILFVEGDKSSPDFQIYQAYYENFTVIPREGCEKVIESVRGLKNNADLHDKKVFGLIDRDFRPQEQITSMQSDGIFCIKLNKIENIFLAPEIIEMVCNYLSKTDKKEEIINEIKRIYKENINAIKFKASKYQIQRAMNEKFGQIKNDEEYNGFKQSIFTETDLISSSIALPDGENVIDVLKEYPHKGLVNEIQPKIELSKNGYKNLVLGFLSSDKRKELTEILKLYLPEINI